MLSSAKTTVFIGWGSSICSTCSLCLQAP